MPSQPVKSSLQADRVTTPSKQKLFHSCGVPLPEAAALQHAHSLGPNQCGSTLIQTIQAPESTVWSVVRQFDKPEAYKHFVKSCNLIFGNGREVGSLREVQVVSGLPAATSMERLEILDEEQHVLSFSVIGGDHRLENYRSYTSLHPIPMGKGYGTLVVESYVVDIPHGNTMEDTCVFINTIVRCNLQSLASICTTTIT